MRVDANMHTHKQTHAQRFIDAHMHTERHHPDILGADA